jgi:transcriptional regulator with XRE-family HTH domain
VRRQPAELARADKSGPDPIDTEVGLNLRRLRLARGHSQTALADALGLTFQQVQKYERGANRVSASMLVKAARFLKVNAADLLPPDDAVEPTRGFVHRYAEIRGAAEMVNAYCALPSPAVRRAVLQLVRIMARDEASGAERETEPDSQ